MKDKKIDIQKTMKVVEKMSKKDKQELLKELTVIEHKLDKLVKKSRKILKGIKKWENTYLSILWCFYK